MKRLRDIWVMTRFDLLFMIRSRETLMWMFLMPVLFMFLIGTVTQRTFGDGPQQKAKMAVRDEDGGVIARAFLRHLAAMDYELVPDSRADSAAATITYRRNLSIPSGFSEGALRGEKQTAKFEIRGEADRRDDLDNVQINRALLLTLGDVAVLTSEGVAISDSSLAGVSRRDKAIVLDVRAAGKRLEIPGGFDQAVPGILVMFVLLVLLTTGGILLVVEREEGLLRRLASAPIERGDIVLAKVCSRVLLGGIQTVFAMLIGWLLFKIDWAGALGGVLLLLAFYSVALAALSVLYGNLARSRGQAVGLGVLSANLMAALGGCWWPIEITPVFMQKIAWGLPTGWTMYGLHRLMAFGEPIAAIVPSLVLLAIATVVFFVLAKRTFRFE